MVGAVPYLSYPDAARAIAWLQGLGFATTTRQDAPDGRVAHCELRLDEAVLMVASDDAAYTVPPLRGSSTGAGVYLTTEDVDGLFRRAVAAGAVPVIEPEDTGWGSRRARVLDPCGREWSFGSYRPGGAASA
ncbi:VOC family protein [Georgenia thermotolerans]|uniref:Bleomycin resistance protein n=1 Tax=Georgenia thermotolerans TaxID=527326 RepID=A0A7J5ULM2_9MICO|nr:VOC family protein [Georgenia thermotolerans]KAE8763171.1 bleomycin resistance protein [Georgenia thermotolerans]